MIACELCKTKYRLFVTDNENECLTKTRYVAAVVLDLTLMIVLFAGLYMLAGYLGDLSLTRWVSGLLPHGKNGTVAYLPFLAYPLFEGRIWFWGFVVFFFILGVVGSCVFCCCRDDGEESNYGHNQYSRGDCWWVCCGPSYHNGYYYYSPYSYWSPTDVFFLWWIMSPHYGYHHHHAACCTGGCGAHDCSACCGAGLGSCGSSQDCGKDGLMVLAVIVIIIVVIFIVIGVFFGSIIAFLLVNKIMKRHLQLLEKQANARKFTVVNLDDPQQVQLSEHQEREGQLTQFVEVAVHDELREPLNQTPKAKSFDLY